MKSFRDIIFQADHKKFYREIEKEILDSKDHHLLKKCKASGRIFEPIQKNIIPIWSTSKENKKE